MACIFIGSGILAGLGSLHFAIAANHWSAFAAILGLSFLVPLVALMLAKNRKPKAQNYLFCLSLLGIMLGCAVLTSTWVALWYLQVHKQLVL